jgi:DNA mismatch repair protein MutS
VIKDDTISVRHQQGEQDYSAAVEETFSKFGPETISHRAVKFAIGGGLNHIQAEILDRIAMLYPNAFRELEEFAKSHQKYLDATVAGFDREVHFYIAYLSHIEKVRGAGLSFCLPQISVTTKEIVGRDTFDIALAERLVEQGRSVITNDLFLRGRERIFVVSGPNQGGKTTFARMFGQLHNLASLGCPVPGKEARLFLCDRLFAHFERKEDIASLRGKLQDDLVRIRQSLDDATLNSIVVMNEIFSSTTLQDDQSQYSLKSPLTRGDLQCGTGISPNALKPAIYAKYRFSNAPS